MLKFPPQSQPFTFKSHLLKANPVILLSLLCATITGKPRHAPVLQDNVNLEGIKPRAEERKAEIRTLKWWEDWSRWVVGHSSSAVSSYMAVIHLSHFLCHSAWGMAVCCWVLGAWCILQFFIYTVYLQNLEELGSWEECRNVFTCLCLPASMPLV